MDAGTVLAGRFRIDGLLGRGGMGAVYAATQIDLKRRVALKLLTDEEDAIVSIEREARAAAQLADPHIVQVTEVVKPDDGPPFLVMELLDGESLDERIARTGALPADRAAFIAVQILSALASAHASGIIHRDVKPANVFLTRTAATNDFVKLLDFGIARRTSGSVISSKGGRRGGTPAYMAPEQIVDAELDERTDVWAVGVCLYEMIAGRSPFEAKNIPALLVKICEADPPPLATNEELAAIVARAMAKDPRERFASAEGMRVALLPIARAGAVPSKHAGTVLPLADDALRDPSDRVEAPTLTAPTPRVVRHEGETIRSKPSGATLPSAPPGPIDPPKAPSSIRAFVTGIVAATSVLGLAIAISSGQKQDQTPAAHASATANTTPASPPECVLHEPLEPWSIAGGHFAIAANEVEVLLSADGKAHGLPRFVTGRGSSPTLEPWEDIGEYFGKVKPGARFTSDATVNDRDEITGVAIKSQREDPKQLPESKYFLFVRRPVNGNLPSWGRSFADLENIAFARVAVLTSATVVLSAGTGPIGIDQRARLQHVRIAKKDRVRFGFVSLPEVELPTDISLSTNPDIIAIAATYTDKLIVGTYDAANLKPQMPIIAYGKPESGQVAILRGEIVAIWIDVSTATPELRHYIIRGVDVTRSGPLVKGDLFAPAIAVGKKQVLLAWGRKSGAEVEILAGSGTFVEDAARSAKVVRVVRHRPVAQIRLAGGTNPWLAWTETLGDDEAVAYAARLDCP